MRHLESQLQQACVKWFRLAYPQHKDLLFAVPNGGHRNIATAKILKAEGVVAGVSDLILLMPSLVYCGMCIEMKVGKGKQTESQRQWMDVVKAHNYNYVICRSFEDFRMEIELYMMSL